MEVALSQIGDTVSQLRQAQTRETAKIEQEIEELEQYVLYIERSCPTYQGYTDGIPDLTVTEHSWMKRRS